MKILKLFMFFMLIQTAWTQSLSFSEKSGFLKLKTGTGSSVYKPGKETLGVTYIRSSQLASIQVIPGEEGRIDLVITTNEMVAKEGAYENKTYTVTVREELKAIERIVDRVINDINIVKLVDRKSY